MFEMTRNILIVVAHSLHPVRITQDGKDQSVSKTKAWVIVMFIF